MNINKLAKDALEISKRRIDLDESRSIDYLKHCSGEVVEAVEAYFRYKDFLSYKEEGDDFTTGLTEGAFSSFSSELADIIICVLLVAAKENVDIEQALLDAMEKNRKRAK